MALCGGVPRMRGDDPHATEPPRMTSPLQARPICAAIAMALMFTAGAARAGEVCDTTPGTDAPSDAPGSQASACGVDNHATGNASAAFGFSNIATSLNSVAFGWDNLASDIPASAFGPQNPARGLGSNAFGFLNIANGEYRLEEHTSELQS